MVGLDGTPTVVTVVGEVDIATASTFGGLLEALVDHGHTDIVLDLEGVEFFDTTGVRVLARVLMILEPLHGRLSLRSVPAHTRRVLDLTGFSELIDIVPSEPTAEVRTGGRILPDVPASSTGVQGAFGSFPASHDTIDAALRLVVTLASATVRGADGASVSLHRHGRLMTAAASDDTILEMDHNQYETGEGPCLSAATEGSVVRVDALVEEDRWPAFVARTMNDGIGSILSSPLLTEGRPIGALNIYSQGEGAFGRDEQELAALFATQVSDVLIDAGAEIPGEESTARIRAALDSRTVIAQAQGMLMERERISADEAAAVLARASRATERTVLDQATEMTRSHFGAMPPPPGATASPSEHVDGGGSARSTHD